MLSCSCSWIFSLFVRLLLCCDACPRQNNAHHILLHTLSFLSNVALQHFALLCLLRLAGDPIPSACQRRTSKPVFFSPEQARRWQRAGRSKPFNLPAQPSPAVWLLHAGKYIVRRRHNESFLLFFIFSCSRTCPCSLCCCYQVNTPVLVLMCP
jgi:hypothetical protein